MDPRGAALGNQVAHWVADKRPHLELGATLERNAGGLGEQAAQADEGQRHQDPGVFGLGLRPQPPGALPVASDRRPQQAPEEDEGKEVEHEGIPLVEPPVEELEVRREEMIDLQDHRAEEQHEEAPVDHGVHQPGLAILHEGAHGETASGLVESLFHHPGAAIRRAPLPIPGSEGEQIHRHPEEHRHRHIEEGDHGARDVAEDLPADLELRFSRQGAEPPEQQRAEDGESGDDAKCMAGFGDPARALLLRLLWWCLGRRHANLPVRLAGSVPTAASPPRV